jgi:hypothetical protein
MQGGGEACSGKKGLAVSPVVSLLTRRMSVCFRAFSMHFTCSSRRRLVLMAKRKRLSASRKRLLRGVGTKRLKVWKSAEWADRAKAEFDEYKKTGDMLKLAQSGEKIWNAFSLRMDERFGRKFFGFLKLQDAIIASGDDELLRVAKDAYWMHVFFYRGYTDDVRMEEGNWLNVYKWLKREGAS